MALSNASQMLRQQSGSSASNVGFFSLAPCPMRDSFAKKKKYIFLLEEEYYGDDAIKRAVIAEVDRHQLVAVSGPENTLLVYVCFKRVFLCMLYCVVSGVKTREKKDRKPSFFSA